MRNVLAGVDAHGGAGGMRGVGDTANRVQRAEHVGHRGDRYELGAVDVAIEFVEAEQAVFANGQPPKLDAALGCEHVPGHDVGVVFHLGEDDRVARAQVGRGPTNTRRG
jgi:hypothetical protein